MAEIVLSDPQIMKIAPSLLFDNQNTEAREKELTQRAHELLKKIAEKSGQEKPVD